MSEVLTHRDGRCDARPHDHAEPARGLQRVQRRPARRAARGAGGGGRPGHPRGRDHGRRPRLLRRPGPEGVPGGPGLDPRAARGDLPPEHPADPRAREAGDRGGQRAVRRRRALARRRVRHPDRRRRRDVRPRVHRDRARPRLGRVVVHPPPARLRARVRVDDVEPEADRGRGARLGARLRGRRGGPVRRPRRRGRGDVRRAADARRSG